MYICTSMKPTHYLTFLLISCFVIGGCINHRSAKNKLKEVPTPSSSGEEKQNREKDWPEDILTLEAAMKSLEKPYEIHKDGNTTTIEYNDKYSSTRYVFVNDTLDYIIHDDFESAFAGSSEDNSQ